MCLKVISYLSICWTFNHLHNYSTKGALCQNIRLSRIGQLECDKTTLVHIETIWKTYDKQGLCKSNSSSISLKFYGYLPTTFDSSNMCIRLYNGMHKKLIMHFQYKDCVLKRNLRTSCQITSIIGITKGDVSCGDQIPSERNITNGNVLCNVSSKCSIPDISSYDRTASIFLHCKDNNNKQVDITTEAKGGNLPDDDTSIEYQGGSSIPDEDISTESTRRSSIPDEDHSTDSTERTSISDKEIRMKSSGEVNYVVIAGAIVGGVFLFICIIVGVFLLRRCTSTASNKEEVMKNLNPSYDPTHVQAEAETNQQGHLMNSADTLYVSTSHAVNVDNPTIEGSNTYSHIRNTVDDSDVMYDHTIRHNMQHTCDGDYGIAHRRVTEDDYDVSGNYRQSLNKEADPVYN